MINSSKKFNNITFLIISVLICSMSHAKRDTRCRKVSFDKESYSCSNKTKEFRRKADLDEYLKLIITGVVTSIDNIKVNFNYKHSSRNILDINTPCGVIVNKSIHSMKTNLCLSAKSIVLSKGAKLLTNKNLVLHTGERLISGRNSIMFGDKSVTISSGTRYILREKASLKSRGEVSITALNGDDYFRSGVFIRRNSKIFARNISINSNLNLIINKRSLYSARSVEFNGKSCRIGKIFYSKYRSRKEKNRVYGTCFRDSIADKKTKIVTTKKEGFTYTVGLNIENDSLMKIYEINGTVVKGDDLPSYNFKYNGIHQVRVALIDETTGFYERRSKKIHIKNIQLRYGKIGLIYLNNHRNSEKISVSYGKEKFEATKVKDGLFTYSTLGLQSGKYQAVKFHKTGFRSSMIINKSVIPDDFEERLSNKIEYFKNNIQKLQVGSSLTQSERDNLRNLETIIDNVSVALSELSTEDIQDVLYFYNENLAILEIPTTQSVTETSFLNNIMDFFIPPAYAFTLGDTEIDNYKLGKSIIALAAFGYFGGLEVLGVLGSSVARLAKLEKKGLIIAGLIVAGLGVTVYLAKPLLDAAAEKVGALRMEGLDDDEEDEYINGDVQLSLPTGFLGTGILLLGSTDSLKTIQESYAIFNVVIEDLNENIKSFNEALSFFGADLGTISITPFPDYDIVPITLSPEFMNFEVVDSEDKENPATIVPIGEGINRKYYISSAVDQAVSIRFKYFNEFTGNIAKVFTKNVRASSDLEDVVLCFNVFSYFESSEFSAANGSTQISFQLSDEFSELPSTTYSIIESNGNGVGAIHEGNNRYINERCRLVSLPANSRTTMTVTSYTVSEFSILYQEEDQFGEGGDIVQNGTRVLNSPKTFYLYLDKEVDGDILNGIYSVQDGEYVSYYGITNPDLAKVFTFTGQNSFVASTSSCGERCTFRSVVIPRGIVIPESKCTKDFPEITCEPSLSSFSSARISQQRDNSYVSFFDRFVSKNMIYENLIKMPGLPY